MAARKSGSPFLRLLVFPVTGALYLRWPPTRVLRLPGRATTSTTRVAFLTVE